MMPVHLCFRDRTRVPKHSKLYKNALLLVFSSAFICLFNWGLMLCIRDGPWHETATTDYLKLVL